MLDINAKQSLHYAEMIGSDLSTYVTDNLWWLSSSGCVQHLTVTVAARTRSRVSSQFA